MSQVSRQRYDILTDTGGDWTDTGPPVNGIVMQTRYVPDGSSPLDTGTDIDIVLAQSGVVVANHDNIGSAAFTKVYKQPVHDTGGAAVSGLREFVPVAGESLRVSVRQSEGVTGVKRGVIYVWTGW